MTEVSWADMPAVRGERLIGDVHTHTTFRDGLGTVGEITAMADAVRLDFVLNLPVGGVMIGPL